MGIDDVPLDIWYLICDYLSMQCIFSLRLVNRKLRAALSDSSIWCQALRKISTITPVIPHPASVNPLHVAFQTTRLDALWNKRPVSKRVCRSSQGNSIRAQLLPGGTHIAVLLGDGTVTIRRTTTLDTEPAITLEPPRNVYDGETTMQISLSSSGEILITTLTTSRFNHKSELTVYKLDSSISKAFRLATVFSSERIYHFAAEGDLLAYGLYGGPWPKEMHEIRICDLLDMAKEEISFFVPPGYKFGDRFYHPTTISILSPRILLLSDTYEVRLFHIPQDRAQPKEILHEYWYSALWNNHKHGAEAVTSPIVWNEPRGHHIGLVAIQALDRLYLLSPSSRPERCHLMSCDIQNVPLATSIKSAISPRRMFWTLAHRDAALNTSSGRQDLVVYIMTFFRISKGQRAISRKGWCKDRLAVGNVTLLVDEDFGHEVLDLSWDEDSGQMAVLTSSPLGAGLCQAGNVLSVYRLQE